MHGLNDAFYVGKSQAESLHVVSVAGMHGVELLKYFLEVLFLDTHAVVFDGYEELPVLIPC